MGVQDKTIKYFTLIKMKPWYWFLAIAGSVLIVGGIIGLTIL